MFAQGVAEDFEISRLQVAAVFADFVEIRVNAPLADFVANHRDTAPPDVIAVIRDCLGGAGVDA